MAGTDEAFRDLTSAPLEELRERRVAAVHLASEAEDKAEGARQLAETYAEAAKELESRSYLSEAQAKRAESKNDAPAAQKLRERVAELLELSQNNYAKADAKGRVAMEHERTSHNHRSEVARIEEQIRRRREMNGA